MAFFDRCLSCIFPLFTATFALQAAINFPSTIPTSGGNIEITSDITFNISTTGSVSGLILNDWVVSDGEANGLSLFGSLGYRVNGGTLQNGSLSFAYDNNSPYPIGFSNVDVNDGVIQFSGVSANAGDTLTIVGQSLNAVFGNPGWNPLGIQNFEGDVFLVDFTGNSVSDVVAVPEFSIFGLGAGLFSLGMLTLRRMRVWKRSAP